MVSASNARSTLAYSTWHSPRKRRNRCATPSQRERLAAAQSVRAFLHPRAVAVVGASRRPGTIGMLLLTNLQRYGFTGPIYPVNPQATEIEGLPAFPTVSAIGAPVDLAIIAVPAPAVEEAVADCAGLGCVASW